MKTTMLVLAISTAALIAVPVTGNAADGKGGFFVNGNVGHSKLNDSVYDDSDTGYSVNGGYRWAFSPAFALGVEGGYTNPGDFSLDSGVVPASPSPLIVGKASIDGWTLGVNAHWNLSDTWYLSGRTGLFNADVKADFVSFDVPFRVKGRSHDMYAGVGVGYDFSDRFSLGLNYDQYKAGRSGLDFDTDRVSASGEMRF